MKAKNPRWVAFLLVGVLPWTLAARAQEEVVAVEPEVEPVEEEREAPPAERPESRFLLEIGYLGATTVGGDHRIGTEYAPGTSTFRTLYMPEEMASGTLYRAGWKLPEEWGEIVGRYWSHNAKAATVVSRPGDFVFGITETIPFVHGIADDGFADAIDASASFKTRDGDLSWRFPLVDKPRFQLHMATGLRKVIHSEDSAISIPLRGTPCRRPSRPRSWSPRVRRLTGPPWRPRSAPMRRHAGITAASTGVSIACSSSPAAPRIGTGSSIASTASPPA